MNSNIKKIIKENVDNVFNERPRGLVFTIGELKKEIANLPDDMKLTSPDGEVTVYVFEGKLTVSTG